MNRLHEQQQQQHFVFCTLYVHTGAIYLIREAFLIFCDVEKAALDEFNLINFLLLSPRFDRIASERR